ncbi:MAG TPA: hypothetical protein VHK02_13680 [Actinomycetota bacterium]|jgi:hypothetical protein|nr:hypothetical protein [Actinomycetota bacterium]
MSRRVICPTLPTRVLRVAFVLGAAVLLAALAAVPASAHAEKQAGRYTFVVGFGDEPAYAGQPNSLQVMITRDGKPATDLAGKLDGLMAHAFYGRKADPKFENAMMPLEPAFGDDWGTPGDYRSFFVPTQAGAYTFELKGKLGDQKINLVVPSGPETFGDVNDPAKAAFPAVKDPTTAQLAQRLDRESARLTASTEAAAAARRDAEEAAGQARMLAFGALLVGLVGLVVAGLAWGRRTATPAGRSEAALSGAGKV